MAGGWLKRGEWQSKILHLDLEINNGKGPDMKYLHSVMAMWAVLATMVLATAEAKAAKMVVYVSSGPDNEIAVFDLDPTSGKLTPKQTTKVDGGPAGLAIDPQHKVLYAAVRGSKGVAAFGVSPESGEILSPLGVTPVADNPVYIVVDHTGKYLLTAYYQAGKAAVYPIAKDGKVDANATQVLTAEKNSHSILMDPTNRFVYVPNCGSDSIMQYQFDSQAGLLNACNPPKAATGAGDGPRHIAFHPQLDVVYFVNEKSSSASAYKLDKKTGVLTALQTISTLPEGSTVKNTCADIHVTPNGKFLYASNRGHDSIACFAIDGATGKLTSLGQQPTEKTPREFDVDPTGNFLIAAGQASDKLATYRINQTSGKLEPLATYAVGKGPAWVLTVTLR